MNKQIEIFSVVQGKYINNEKIMTERSQNCIIYIHVCSFDFFFNLDLSDVIIY